MFSKLVKPGPENDGNTIQCLEIVFNSSIFVSEKMVKDQLGDGKYGNPTSELIQQSKYTATTNAAVERDLGRLGRLKET